VRHNHHQRNKVWWLLLLMVLLLCLIPMAQKDPSPLSHTIPLSMLRSKLSFFFMPSHFISPSFYLFLLTKPMLLLLEFNFDAPSLLKVLHFRSDCDKNSLHVLTKFLILLLLFFIQVDLLMKKNLTGVIQWHLGHIGRR